VALDCNSSILKLLAAGEFPPSHKAERGKGSEGGRKTFNYFAYSKDGVVFQRPSRAGTESEALKQKSHK
jgi:hypothetical protein